MYSNDFKVKKDLDAKCFDVNLARGEVEDFAGYKKAKLVFFVISYN